MRFSISQTRQGVTGATFQMVCYLFAVLTLHTSQVVRNEVGPSDVDIGQVAQVMLKFRVLHQLDGSFIFREPLKSVCILDDGISAVSLHYTMRQ